MKSWAFSLPICGKVDQAHGFGIPGQTVEKSSTLEALLSVGSWKDARKTKRASHPPRCRVELGWWIQHDGGWLSPWLGQVGPVTFEKISKHFQNSCTQAEMLAPGWMLSSIPLHATRLQKTELKATPSLKTGLKIRWGTCQVELLRRAIGCLSRAVCLKHE